MKLKMTVEEALEFADEWSRGMTIHEGSQGWRVVCMLLAEEVRQRAGNGGELIAARRERDELAAELANAGDAEIDWLRNALEHIAGSCEGRAAEIAREALMGPND